MLFNTFEYVCLPAGWTVHHFRHHRMVERIRMLPAPARDVSDCTRRGARLRSRLWYRQIH
jgi:hypothetical protein